MSVAEAYANVILEDMEGRRDMVAHVGRRVQNRERFIQEVCIALCETGTVAARPMLLRSGIYVVRK